MIEIAASGFKIIEKFSSLVCMHPGVEKALSLREIIGPISLSELKIDDDRPP